MKLNYGILTVAAMALIAFNQSSAQPQIPMGTKEFMREKLEFSYATYALLYATPFAARVVALSWIGEFAHRRGAAWTVWFGALLLVPFFQFRYQFLGTIAEWETGVPPAMQKVCREGLPQ